MRHTKAKIKGSKKTRKKMRGGAISGMNSRMNLDKKSPPGPGSGGGGGGSRLSPSKSRKSAWAAATPEVLGASSSSSSSSSSAAAAASSDLPFRQKGDPVADYKYPLKDDAFWVWYTDDKGIRIRVISKEWDTFQKTGFRKGKDFMIALSKFRKTPFTESEIICGGKVIDDLFMEEFLALENMRSKDKGGTSTVVRKHFQKSEASTMADRSSKLPYLQILADHIMDDEVTVTRPKSDTTPSPTFCLTLVLKDGKPKIPYQLTPRVVNIKSSEYSSSHGPPLKMGALCNMLSRVLSPTCKTFLEIHETFGSTTITDQLGNLIEDMYTLPFNGASLLLHWIKLDNLDQMYPGYLRCLCNVDIGRVIEGVILFDTILLSVKPIECEEDEKEKEAEKHSRDRSSFRFTPSVVETQKRADFSNPMGEICAGFGNKSGKSQLFNSKNIDVWLRAAINDKKKTKTLIGQVVELGELLSTNEETKVIYKKTIGSEDFKPPKEGFEAMFTQKNGVLKTKLEHKRALEIQAESGKKISGITKFTEPIFRWHYRQTAPTLLTNIQKTKFYNEQRELLDLVSSITLNVHNLFTDFIRRQATRKASLTQEAALLQGVNNASRKLGNSFRRAVRRESQVFSGPGMEQGGAPNNHSGSERLTKRKLTEYENIVATSIKRNTQGDNTSASLLEQLGFLNRAVNMDDVLLRDGETFYVKDDEKLVFKQRDLQEIDSTLTKLARNPPGQILDSDEHTAIVVKYAGKGPINFQLFEVTPFIDRCIISIDAEKLRAASQGREPYDDRRVVYAKIMQEYGDKCGAFQYILMIIVLENLDAARKVRYGSNSEMNGLFV